LIQNNNPWQMNEIMAQIMGGVFPGQQPTYQKQSPMGPGMGQGGGSMFGNQSPFGAKQNPYRPQNNQWVFNGQQ
jgi:hypothetical protein